MTEQIQQTSAQQTGAQQTGARETGTQAGIAPRRKRAYLERLVINVSHDCNLRCAYCYADTGAYGDQRKLLAQPLGRKIVDDFFSRFGKVGRIQFFGGEPFMNVRGIEDLCGYITETCRNESMPLPRFTLISNGTLVNDDVIDLINRYRIAVTVSLDGTREINDANRVYASGKGSYEKVIENIRILKDRTEEPKQIEGTYSAKHVEQDFSIADFLKFMARELDVRSLHMPWVVGEAYNGTGIVPTDANVARTAKAFRDGVSASLQSLLSPDLEDVVLFAPLERALLRELSGGGGEREHICPAGSGTLAVGADGKVSPCFMFTNNRKFEFTRVGQFDDSTFDRLRKEFVGRLAVPTGENGRSYETGSSCAGQNYDVTGEVDQVLEASRHLQLDIDNHIRDELAAVKADADKWEWLQAKLLLHQIALAGAATTSC